MPFTRQIRHQGPALLTVVAGAAVVALLLAGCRTMPTEDGVSGPAPGGTAAGTGQGYLSTDGTDIVDERGDTVRLTGLNWFGNETADLTFHGLWSDQSWTAQIDQMADLGFNAIRVPYSDDILEPGTSPTGLNPAANGDLAGLTSLQILDRVVDHAGSRGMRILLDRHRPTSSGQTALWYTEDVPESTWIANWQALAERYLGNPVVIGADLHNEPHGEGPPDEPAGACWGCDDPERDWRLAAERAGNAIHEVNPDWLIVVEGVSCVHGSSTGPAHPNDTCGWWGGNLSRAGTHPVRLGVENKLVYSTHDYGMSVHSEQPWFTDPGFPETLRPFWRAQWGYLVEDGVAPVLVGELGSTLEHPQDREWLPRLVAYLDELGAGFMYWSWNPNSGDTGGIVGDDWATVETARYDVLRRSLVPPVAAAGATTSPSGPAGPAIVPAAPSSTASTRRAARRGAADPERPCSSRSATRSVGDHGATLGRCREIEERRGTETVGPPHGPPPTRQSSSASSPGMPPTSAVWRTC